MLRTRDFILFFAVIVFLLIAITATVWHSGRAPGSITVSKDMMFDSTTATYTAAVVSTPDTKSDRLAILRKKISDLGPMIAASEPTEPAATEPDVPAATSTVAVTDTVDLCATYRIKSVPDLTGQLLYVERDGSRVFYSNASQFAVATATVSDTIVLTLPLRTTPLNFASCIGTDVVAVTVSGAPIRNADYAKYHGLGEATLIGYTLDGFPLYGATSNLATDSCGGASIGGAYRYYLSEERDGVLGCFSGIPITL